MGAEHRGNGEKTRVVDPDLDPYWIRIQLGIRNPDPDPDPGGQK